jgi:hypothetical protein
MGHKFILMGLDVLLSAFSSVMASGLIKKWPVGSLARSVDIKKENLEGVSDDLYFDAYTARLAFKEMGWSRKYFYSIAMRNDLEMGQRIRRINRYFIKRQHLHCLSCNDYELAEYVPLPEDFFIFGWRYLTPREIHSFLKFIGLVKGSYHPPVPKLDMAGLLNLLSGVSNKQFLTEKVSHDL